MDGNSRSHDRSSQDAKAESAMRKAGETQQHCVWGGEVFFPNVQRSIKNSGPCVFQSSNCTKFGLESQVGLDLA